MSLALYRTYRPSRLDEVIGQEHVTEPLRRALDGGRVHHAYLFSGPRGCGKTSTARILARSLICEEGPTSEPCGQCQFCVALAANGPGLVDVIELDAASHGGVDDTRELRERAAFVPASARYKVYIIDEAHMVTKDGFNALLKLIEEPPEHLKFIFATTEVEKVLPTIRSRTFNYAFRLVPSRALQENLSTICAAEEIPAEPSALSLIARASGGSVRDAQSILGQLIAGASEAGLLQTEVAEQLGVTDDALLDRTLSAVADHDGAELFATVSSVIDSGHDPRRFVTDLLHQFRNLTLLQHLGDAATGEMLDVSDERRDELAAQSSAFGPAEVARMTEMINEGLTHIKGSTSPRLQLEILMSRLLLPAVDTDRGGVLARLEALERRTSALASGAVPVHPPSGSEPSAPPRERSFPEPAVAQAPPVGEPPDVVSDEKPMPAEPSRSASASRTPPDARPGKRGGPPPPPSLRSLREDSGADHVPAATEPAPSDSAGEPVLPADEPVTTAEAEDAVARIRNSWPQIMAAVAEQSRVARAAWEGAEPLGVTAGELMVRVPSAGQEASIRASGRTTALRTLLVERFGIDVTVGVTATATAALGEEPDVPAHDDPDLGSTDLSGVDLAMRELGATKIGEIEG